MIFSGATDKIFCPDNFFIVVIYGRNKIVQCTKWGHGNVSTSVVLPLGVAEKTLACIALLISDKLKKNKIRF